MEYHGKIVHTIGRKQHIDLMSRMDICYTSCHISTQTVAPTLPGKRCIQYLDSHSHKPIFNTFLILMMYQMSSDLHGFVIKLNTQQQIIF